MPRLRCLAQLALLASLPGRTALEQGWDGWLPDSFPFPDQCASDRCRLGNQADLARVTGVRNLLQLKPLVQRLNAGLPVTVAAIGSSITADFAGCFHTSLDALRSRVNTLPITIGLNPTRIACAANSSARFGFASALMSAINKTWPHPDHLLLNSGWGGATLSSFHDRGCATDWLPRELDLLLLEQYQVLQYGRGANEPQRPGEEVERLWNDIRTNLVKPPAVFLLHFGDVLPLRLQTCLYSGGTTVGSCGLAECQNWTHFMSPARSHQREEALDVTAHYYGWSSFSMRNLVASAFRDGMHTSRNESECVFMAQVFRDRIHPADRGAMLLGNALIQHLADAVDFHRAFQTTLPVQPPDAPLAAGAWVVERDVCMEAAALNVSDARNWAFHATEMVAGREVPKPGHISSAADGMLQVELALARQGTHTITILYLRSYSPDMGAASVACSNGCMCPSLTLLGGFSQTEPYKHVSIVESSRLVADSPAGACRLTFSVNTTALETPGFKFKLLGLSWQK